MKTIALIALLLPVLASASDITIYAIARKDDPATFSLLAGPKETKLLRTRASEVMDIGNGPEPSWPMMEIGLSDGVASRIKDYATAHDLKVVHLRVFIGKDYFDTSTMPALNFGALRGDILFVGIPPNQK